MDPSAWEKRGCTDAKAARKGGDREKHLELIFSLGATAEGKRYWEVFLGGVKRVPR